MWKFSDLPYVRPDEQALREAFEQAIDRLWDAADYAQAREAYLAIDSLPTDFATQATICYVRNSLDVTDAFYQEEMRQVDRMQAEFMPLQKRANETLLATPFRAQFEKEFGAQLFVAAELEKRTQSEAIIPEKIRESELKNEYSKLMGECTVTIDGETMNFYGLLKRMQSPDRQTRRQAYLSWAELYEGVADRLDGIYDELIALRLSMAEKLGFESFTGLGYANMGRTAYGPAEVASFRKQVREVIVPAVARYRKAQAERLGVDKLRYYDESLVFPDGNANPVGGVDVLLPIATQMYRELSAETGEFFDFMVEHALFDLDTRPGKGVGGYCTGLQAYKAPFIFSNFNGTSADVDVLTHEAGHAFAYYCAARAQPLGSYLWSTSEVAEIHSMSMEHFTYPWLGKFFGEENAKKARFAHLMEALSSIPYLVSVDEYQHRVYERPQMTAGERRALWREIEQIYMPWRDYDGVAFLEEGGFWMQKQHIFLYPFYYVDYALAQTCAFELYGRMKTDPQAAWADYVRLCKAGGGYGYFELLRQANLSSPFAEGSVQRAVGHVVAELDAK